MTIAALAIAYVVICAYLAFIRKRAGGSAALAGGLAAAMVCVQFALLLTR